MKKSEALKILGLSEGASDDEIKAAHRKKVIEHHPDRFAFNSEEADQAEEKTKLVNEARDVLLSRKWEPEYAYRGPYASPYGNSRSSGRRGSGVGANPYEDWPFGQGQAQPTWVWTSWDGVVGQDGQPFGPFSGAQEHQKSPQELKEEAKKNLVNDAIAIVSKIVLLTAFALFGSLATGLFIYVIISVVYGMWKRLGGCLIAFFVPIAFILIPFMMIIAPQAGGATFGLIVACILCFIFDVNNIYRGVQRYRSIKE